MVKIIDGKKISQDIKNELKNEVDELKKQNTTPGLAVVIVGEDPASKVYVRNKEKACEEIGIKSFAHVLPEETSEENLLSLIDELNNNSDVHGILVQLPLPKHIDSNKIIFAIDPKKDVDGFHPENVGKMTTGNDALLSCTPAGMIELLKREQIQIEGSHCVVIGKSNIVGKPVSILLLNEGGTISVCHSKTKNLKEITKQADILVVAVGKPNFVTPDMIKEGVVIIDVGINRLDNGKIVGDADFEACEEKASAITPVPGGVGPMTIAMLMKNCIKSASYYAKFNTPPPING